MNKRGQVALFVIIGIIILILVIIVLSVKSDIFHNMWGKITGEQLALPQQVEEIDSFVKECIETVGNEGVYVIGQKGGYFNLPQLFTDFGVPFYFYRNESIILSKEKVGEELGLYINSELFFCTRGFIEFPEFMISQDRVRTTAIVEETQIILDVEYPLEIIRGSNQYILKDFRVILESNLGNSYSVASEIIEKQVEDPSSICLSCILEIGEEREVSVLMENFGDTNTLFTIRADNYLINDLPYEFIFANGYG